MSELIDREALKDAVKRYAGEPIKAKDKKCQAICLDMLGTIDAQPAASPWHRVEEELPERGRFLLDAHRAAEGGTVNGLRYLVCDMWSCCYSTGDEPWQRHDSD